MDAITLLKNDHRDVEKLFKRFEKAGDGAYIEKRDVVDRIIEALSKHAVIEEQLFYPVSRATVEGTEDIVLESLEEHHVVKWLLSELDDMEPQHERFDAKVTVLIENVRHHVEEEEEEFFPKVRDELGRKALGELGDAMAQARAIAPTHPHPRSPDTPPGNIIAGAGAGVVDRFTDTVSGVAQGGVAALQDVIARVTGSKKRAPSTRGTPTAKRASARTRGGATEATDRAVAAVKKARRTGEDAVDDARRSVAKTVRPAPAKRTARTRTGASSRTTRTAAGTRRKAGGTTKKAARTTTGTAKRTARTTTGTAKRTARQATGTAKRATRRATGTTKRTARTARPAAKRTARKAAGTTKKAARATRTTAKRAARTTTGRSRSSR
jgi:hemerythrin superfamily protein